MIIDHGKNYQFLRDIMIILQGEIMNIFFLRFAIVYYEHKLFSLLCVLSMSINITSKKKNHLESKYTYLYKN